MATIEFYKYNGHPNTINKTLGDATIIQGDIRHDMDVLHPLITLRVDARPTYNYCHIPTTGKYYFIDSIVFIGGKDYKLRLSVDVLKTYEQEITAATATVTERANPDKHISNRAGVYDIRPNFEKIDFPNKGLINLEGTVIMVTIKGNK